MLGNSLNSKWRAAQFFFCCTTKTVPSSERYFPKNRTLAPQETDMETLAQKFGSCLKQQKCLFGEASPTFIVGASTSEHQCSPGCYEKSECCMNKTNGYHCSYARFAEERNYAKSEDLTNMDLWKYYREYFHYLKNDLNLNSVRFSVEWSRVQPHQPISDKPEDIEASFNQEALDHYAKMFCYAIELGITPVVCLHHYTDPCWFIDRDGFEKQENLQYFTTFCKRVFTTLMERATNEDNIQALNALSARPPLWATFNSPEGDALKGYRENSLPPANPRKNGLLWAEQVLCNICEAHVSVYHELHEEYDALLKQHKELPKLMVGILKNIHQLDPWSQSINPLTTIACKVGNLIQNEFIFNFFTKGIFDAPTFEWHNEKAIGALDFIGLNYYSNRYMDGSKKVLNSGARKTNNANYGVYPLGIYRALMEISHRVAEPLNIPIYITENGIATDNNDQRASFYRSYLNAINQAMEDGCWVKGYLTWALIDNAEWGGNVGDRRCYGLATVSKEEPNQPIMKDGALPLVTFAEQIQKAIAAA